MTTYRYIGQFQDHNYGIDRDGELFESIEDAKRKLYNRLALGYWVPQPVVKPNGLHDEWLMPAVTPEARIFLWAIDPITTEGLDTERDEYLPPITLPEGKCEVHVYISRRGNGRSERIK